MEEKKEIKERRYEELTKEIDNPKKNKPTYTMDLFPSPEKFGKHGFLLMILATILMIIMAINYEFIIVILGIIMLLLGTYIGREIEAAYYKPKIKQLKDEINILKEKLKTILIKELEEEDDGKNCIEKKDTTKKRRKMGKETDKPKDEDSK